MLGSCGLTVAFRLTDHDAVALAPRFGLRPRALSGQPNLQATLHRADLGGSEPAYTCVLDPYEDLDVLAEPVERAATDQDERAVALGQRPDGVLPSRGRCSTVLDGAY